MSVAALVLSSVGGDHFRHPHLLNRAAWRLLGEFQIGAAVLSCNPVRYYASGLAYGDSTIRDFARISADVGEAWTTTA